MNAPFAPSAVVLTASFPPLLGTFGRTELECAAAILVRACVLGGDLWQPVTPADVRAALVADVEAGAEPLSSLNTNPACWPDFGGLIAGGFARYSSAEGSTEPGGSRPIEFTLFGLTRLRAAVRS